MSLHTQSLVIDGLIISKWDRGVFEDMRKGGLAAANCTVSVWEGFKDTVANIAAMKRQIRDNADLLTLVRKTADIEAAKRANKTGIILGFQNAQAFEDNLGTIEAFWDMGVRVVQLCYNTQNLIGTGCYERDGGLSGYGREVIAEMNRVGIMVDLSHVGARTSEEAILESKKAVCYSHCLPAGLKQHPRNKSDEQLQFIAAHGGFIGVTMFPPFLKRGTDATVDDYVEAIGYVINLVGEDCVGFGTDFTQGYGKNSSTSLPTTRAATDASQTSERCSIRPESAPSARRQTSPRRWNAPAGPPPASRKSSVATGCECSATSGEPEAP